MKKNGVSPGKFKIASPIILCFFAINIFAKPIHSSDSAGTSPILTLTECVKFALKNQPALNQYFIDEAISGLNKKLATSSWLPQVNANGTYQQYFTLPTSFSTVNNNLVAVQTGVYNYVYPQINITQNIFSADALFASRVARLNSDAARENTHAGKINLVATVSKAFYDILLSIEQVGVYSEDTARLSKNKADAWFRYQSGLVDKVDFKQANISLNNSRSRLTTAVNIIDAKKAFLQQLMGFPENKPINLLFDTAQMLQETYVDTLAPLYYEKRIEYKQMLIGKQIQQNATRYYKMGFLPSFSAFYTYNYELEHNELAKLFNKGYPYSLAGLQLNIPIFSGFRRLENIRKSELQENRLDWDLENLRHTIFTQYQSALAAYKSTLYNLNSQRENVTMAREVYDIVRLQYREGVKTYLDVIIAESDLQTSEINYLNALFQLLASKIDLQQAMGDISGDI